MTADEEKAARYRAEFAAWSKFVDQRIPELHRNGVPGRQARELADREYAESKRAAA